MATLRILNHSGDDDLRIKAIADRFADITIGALPTALREGDLLSEDEFTAAAVVVTLAVAMAFMASICPSCRREGVDSFLEALGESLRSSVDAQNLHDTDAKGQA